MTGSGDSSWTTWERHPAGEEVVVVISGRLTLVQELDGAEHRVELAEGQAAINPRNVWHTADIAEPLWDAMFADPADMRVRKAAQLRLIERRLADAAKDQDVVAALLRRLSAGR